MAGPFPIAHVVDSAYTVGMVDGIAEGVDETLDELRILAARERDMTSDLEQVRARIEELVRTKLLGGDPPRGMVGRVERATGYSREWVRRLRDGKSAWRADSPKLRSRPARPTAPTLPSKVPT